MDDILVAVSSSDNVDDAVVVADAPAVMEEAIAAVVTSEEVDPGCTAADATAATARNRRASITDAPTRKTRCCIFDRMYALNDCPF